VPGLKITIDDADNDREVTFTLDVTVVTALFQSVNGQDFSIYDSNGPTGGTLSFHEAVRVPGILAGYKGEWSATESWGRYGRTSGIWYPWFRGGDRTHMTYVCPDNSVKTFDIYGAAQLYDTIDCHNGPDWLICTSEGCNTNLLEEICPSP